MLLLATGCDRIQAVGAPRVPRGACGGKMPCLLPDRNDQGPMRKRLWILLWLLTLVSLAGQGGEWHWLLDLCNHFRLQYVGIAWVLLALACLLRDRRCIALGIVVAWLCLGLWSWPFRRAWVADAPLPGAQLSVVTVNLLIGNRDLTTLGDWLRKVRPDVLVVEELDARAAEILDLVDPQLRRIWVQTEEEGAFGLGVWSRVPTGAPEPRALGPYALASARVPLLVGEGAPLQLFATHPFPPIGAAGSAARDAQFAELADWINAHPGAALLVGDLNATPWSMPLQTLAAKARLADGSHCRWPVATWRPLRLGMLAPLLALPIDHVLLRGGRIRTLERGPDMGSDHWPLLARIALAQVAGTLPAARIAATTADSNAPGPAARH